MFLCGKCSLACKLGTTERQKLNSNSKNNTTSTTTTNNNTNSKNNTTDQNSKNSKDNKQTTSTITITTITTTTITKITRKRQTKNVTHLSCWDTQYVERIPSKLWPFLHSCDPILYCAKIRAIKTPLLSLVGSYLIGCAENILLCHNLLHILLCLSSSHF